MAIVILTNIQQVYYQCIINTIIFVDQSHVHVSHVHISYMYALSLFSLFSLFSLYCHTVIFLCSSQSPLYFLFNMWTTAGKSKTRKHLECRCPVYNVTFWSQGFSALSRSVNIWKGLKKGKGSMNRNCERCCLQKLLVHVVLFSCSSIHLTLPLFSPKWS